jgi:hypothetical protein
MADYLIRRNGRYSYRRRYPNEVAILLKRTEFVQALGTADPKEAARLARAVSVQFDNQCELALRELIKTPAMASEPPSGDQVQSDNAEVAKGVLERLPGIIRQMTELVIAEQARNSAGWMDQIDWRRRALKEHIAGRMPAGINWHPLEAQVALNAMEAAVEGKPLSFDAVRPVQAVEPKACAIAGDPERLQPLNQATLEAALAEYAHGKSHRRRMLANRQALRILRLPCTHQQAVTAISNWCKDALTSGKKPSSVWTEASAVGCTAQVCAGLARVRRSQSRRIKAAERRRRSSTGCTSPNACPNPPSRFTVPALACPPRR